MVVMPWKIFCTPASRRVSMPLLRASLRMTDRCAGNDQFANVVFHVDDFEQGSPAFIAGIFAVAAAFAVEEFLTGDVFVSRPRA